MNTDRSNEADADAESDESSRDNAVPEPGAGDDERDNRQQIAETGEPNRDALGNADGAS